MKCDESGATGESDAIKKLPFSELLKSSDGHAHTDCFMISGSKVTEGVGKYVIVAVGTKSFNGRIMMGTFPQKCIFQVANHPFFTALRTDTENTPLQVKLNNLAELIAKIGLAAGLLLFVALMIKFFVLLGTKFSSRCVPSLTLTDISIHGSFYSTASEWGMLFVNNLIISVTVIVVAVPEGVSVPILLLYVTNDYEIRFTTGGHACACVRDKAHDLRESSCPSFRVLRNDGECICHLH